MLFQISERALFWSRELFLAGNSIFDVNDLYMSAITHFRCGEIFKTLFSPVDLLIWNIDMLNERSFKTTMVLDP